jgi:ketosteroid isomerase-like protein
MTNKEIIAAVFAETAKGNGRPYLEAMAENVTWRTIGKNSWSGTFTGKETIMKEIFGRLRERFEGHNTCIPSRIHADGDYVIVQANGHNRTRDGKDYCNDYCFVIRMRDGKMAAIEEYCDTELVANVLGERVCIADTRLTADPR